MPQPGEVSAAADDLIALYAAAEQRLLDRYIQILGDPSRSTEASRLRDLLRQVDGELGRLDVKTRDWFRTRYPAIYQLGATEVAAGGFSWTQEHREAAQALAHRSYSDLLANTQHAGASLKRAVRDSAARDTARAILDGTTTPQRAAVDMRRAVQAETGASTVTYSNGAKHSLADYADTSIRTLTANTYNEGSFTQMRGDNITYCLVADGPACGWDGHDDSDLAAGTVRSLEECEANPLSHPRCARSFSPMPEVTNDHSAAKASVPLEERQAAAEAERARADAQPVKFSVEHQAALDARPARQISARSARVAREPRTARTARQQS